MSWFTEAPLQKLSSTSYIHGNKFQIILALLLLETPNDLINKERYTRLFFSEINIKNYNLTRCEIDTRAVHSPPLSPPGRLMKEVTRRTGPSSIS